MPRVVPHDPILAPECEAGGGDGGLPCLLEVADAGVALRRRVARATAGTMEQIAAARAGVLQLCLDDLLRTAVEVNHMVLLRLRLGLRPGERPCGGVHVRR